MHYLSQMQIRVGINSLERAFSLRECVFAVLLLPVMLLNTFCMFQNLVQRKKRAILIARDRVTDHRKKGCSRQ